MEIDQIQTGSLTVYAGPMCSGKSSEVIARLSRHGDTITKHRGGARPLYINSSLDLVRSGTGISSHASRFSGAPDNIDIVTTTLLSDVDVSDREIIGIDEAQFFKDLVETSRKWLKMGKHLVCGGLSGDSNLQPIGKIHELLCIADEFILLRAICHYCISETKGAVLRYDKLSGMRASFTVKISGDLQQQVDVGDAESKYRPVCRNHHHKVMVDMMSLQTGETVEFDTRLSEAIS